MNAEILLNFAWKKFTVYSLMGPIHHPITHVIFDVDGLLLDTESLYTKCYVKMFAKFGVEFPLNFKTKLMGLSASKSAQLSVREFNLPTSWEDFQEEIICEQLKEFPRSELMSGARETIEHLYDSGVPIGVATSSRSQTFAIKTQNHQELFRKMLVTINGDDPAVKEGKPAPDIFLEAAKRLNADPKRCLVFEDSPNGVRAALAAEMQVVWIPDPLLDYSIDHHDLFHHHRVHIHSALLDVRLDKFGLPSRSSSSINKKY